MIISEIYDGQGFGNQLWAYAITKAVAKESKATFAVLSSHRFKLRDVLLLDWGESPIHLNRSKPTTRNRTGRFHVYHEQVRRHPDDNMDITEFDSNLLKISRNWRLEGNFQSEKYLYGIKDTLISDFTISPKSEKRKNTCVINLRGGEYKHYPSLFLKQAYYRRAMKHIQSISPYIDFEIVTDDIDLAKTYFPNLKIRSRPISSEYSLEQKISDDFSALQEAEYLILSNSSFSWWGAWTNKNCKCVVAPKYWARHNIGDGFWSTGDSLTDNWLWVDKEGEIFSAADCHNELSKFKKTSKYLETYNK